MIWKVKASGVIPNTGPPPGGAERSRLATVHPPSDPAGIDRRARWADPPRRREVAAKAALNAGDSGGGTNDASRRAEQDRSAAGSRYAVDLSEACADMKSPFSSTSMALGPGDRPRIDQVGERSVARDTRTTRFTVRIVSTARRRADRSRFRSRRPRHSRPATR